MNKQMHAVLHALEMDPLPVSAIAKKAGVSEDEAANALRELALRSVAIEEDGQYELSGPLSWFGSFAAAVRHNAKKHFVVRTGGDADTHLYVDDVRVKGRRKVGDPENETVTVFACGRTALSVIPAFGEEAPSCEECRNAAG